MIKGSRSKTEQACSVLAETRLLLTEATPESCAASGPLLERAAQLAADGLEEFHRQSVGDAARSAAAIRNLRRELTLVQALHENAQALARGWMQVLGRLAGTDYLAGGQPDWPAGALGTRVSVEG